MLAGDDGDIDKDELILELNAGRIVQAEEDTIVNKMLSQTNMIGFLDFLVYIPLFLNINDDILHNPLKVDRRSLIAETSERVAMDQVTSSTVAADAVPSPAAQSDSN